MLENFLCSLPLIRNLAVYSICDDECVKIMHVCYQHVLHNWTFREITQTVEFVKQTITHNYFTVGLSVESFWVGGVWVCDWVRGVASGALVGIRF